MHLAKALWQARCVRASAPLFSASLASRDRIAAVPLSRAFGRRPVAGEHELLIGLDAHLLGRVADQLAPAPPGLGNSLLRKVMTAPLGPASTFSTLAVRHSALTRMTLSSASTSSGSGPKRSISSAPAASISRASVEVAQPAIELHAQLQVGHVVLGDHHRHAERDLRAPLVPAPRSRRRRRVSAGDRLLEHRLVELEADLADVARLLLAEQVAGAADIEVVARQLEAGAQAFERLQHAQPPLGGVGQLAVRRAR